MTVCLGWQAEQILVYAFPYNGKLIHLIFNYSSPYPPHKNVVRTNEIKYGSALGSFVQNYRKSIKFMEYISIMITMIV